MSLRTLSLFLAVVVVHGLVAPRSALGEPIELAVESSVVAPVMRGASLGGRLRFEGVPHLALGAGVYALTVPQFMIDGSANNEFEHWKVAVRPAVHLSADYFVRQNGTGFSAGITVGLARFVVSSDIVAGSTAFTSAYLLPRAAYTWFLADHWYINGWIGLQLDGQVAGSTQLGTRMFTPFGIMPQLNLNVGYVFAQ